MKELKEHNNVCGIYMIRNKINNKIYVGKSKNIMLRIRQHRNDLSKPVRQWKRCNEHFFNAWHKYGSINFEYKIIEICNLAKTSERELYWIETLNTCDKNHGYNLRKDSSTNMIVNDETKLKISERLKREWATGIRSNHSEKMKQLYEREPWRVAKIKSTFTKALTKYKYLVKKENVDMICTYKELLDLGLGDGLNNICRNFKKNGSTKTTHKGYIIERLKI